MVTKISVVRSELGLKVCNLFLTIWNMNMECQVPRIRNKSPTVRPYSYLVLRQSQVTTK